MFFDESRFSLNASDGRVLVRKIPGERLRHRHTGPTPDLMVWGAISYDGRSTLVIIPNTMTANLYVSLVIQPIVLPFMNSIPGRVFQQENARSHTVIEMEHALQSVDMLPWPVGLWSRREKKKEKWDDKRVENREGSLGYPGFVTPVFTKDSKLLGKRKRSLGHLGIVTPVLN
ncbi:uncharacterized protein TNCV_4023431 [Trichonephila clavipes]|nr:uncharacterized protein TNCV_4023431 [Trichonephila clavipes]